MSTIFDITELTSEGLEQRGRSRTTGNGDAFRGWIDDFVLDGTVLSDGDLAKLTSHR